MDYTVEVAGGRVRGHESGGLLEFLGIPYGRAPVGALRWRPPEPPEPWANVRDATEPGPLAPQGPAAASTALPGDPIHQSEDCLHLSIWTPGLDSARRPVMVWVHGGRFVSGTAGSLLYRGERLARRGDVVVVSVNYRLGALGFLAHPALSGPEGTFGNWGLADQVAALRWVRAHVGAFGGDPDNVTLFGESAGAMCISTLLAMPDARGLFRRVIVQSGPPYTHSATRAVAAAEEFARELGLQRVERSALERIPAADLVSALGTIGQRPARAGELPQPLLPVVDGHSLPGDPLVEIGRGCASRVAAVIGTNRDEASYFDFSERRAAAMDEGELLRLVSHSAPTADAHGVVDAYRAALERREERFAARDIWIAVASDLVFRWPSLRLADALRMHASSVFVYLFTWESPAFGGVLGACHGLEIPFVFGNVSDPAVAPFSGAGPEAEELAGSMQDAWLSFARRGDPSIPGRLDWPPWDPLRRVTMKLGASREAVVAPRDAELAVWASSAPLPTAVPPAESVPGPRSVPAPARRSAPPSQSPIVTR